MFQNGRRVRKWRKTSSFKTHRAITVVHVIIKAAKKRVVRAHEAISGGEIRAKAGQAVAVLRVAMVRPVAMGDPAVNGDFVAMADPITIGGPVATARPAAPAAMLSWRPRSPLSNHCLRSIPLW